MSAPKLINELSQVSSLSADDFVPVMQGGVTYYAKPSQFITQAASFTQSGTGAVSRSVQDRLRDIVSVQDFGAATSASAIHDATSSRLASLTVSPRFQR